MDVRAGEAVRSKPFGLEFGQDAGTIPSITALRAATVRDEILSYTHRRQWFDSTNGFMSVTGPGYPQTSDWSGYCFKCRRRVFGGTRDGVATPTHDDDGVHDCSKTLMTDPPKLVINYERRVKKMRPSPYRTLAPLGRREVKFVSTNTNISKEKVPPLTPRQLLERRYAQLCGMRGSGEITESQVEEFHFLKKKLGVE